MNKCPRSVRLRALFLIVLGLTGVGITDHTVSSSPLSENRAAAQEILDHPVQFMLKGPLHNDKNAGGFYVGTLADGTVINMNLLFSRDTHNPKVPILQGAFWYPDRFVGRVYPFEADLPGGISTFGFRFKWVAGVIAFGTQSISWAQQSLIDEHISALSPDNGHGIFLTAPHNFDISFKGKVIDNRSTVTGRWTDHMHHRAQQVVFRRVFAYRRIIKGWPFYESTEAKNSVIAKFNAVFPMLPYASVQAHVLKDVASCDNDGVCDSEVTVVGFNHGLLTLRIWNFSASRNGSGGSSDELGAGYLVYRVNNHGTSVNLSDLIDDSGACGTKINALASNRLNKLLRRMDVAQAMPPGLKDKPLGSFSGLIWSAAGVTFQYQPSDLDLAGVMGEVFVTLSDEDLGTCVRSQK